MHALALEFTYLWKLNREHWLRVWCHICMRLQLWTGTSALTRARPCSHVHTASSLWTAGSVCSVSALFVPSVSHNGPCAVCVCTAPTAQTALVSDPFGIQAHSGWLLLKTHTKLSRLGPGSRLQNRGQVHWEIRETFRNAPDPRGPAFYR